MERSWSESARAAIEAYPWSDELQKERAIEECELVAFGDRVEMEDLPLNVRRWLRANNAPAGSVRRWNGESWKELTEAFEKDILSQALAANGGIVAKTARALRTTPRVVDYKAKKYKLTTKQTIKKEEQKDKKDHGTF